MDNLPSSTLAAFLAYGRGDQANRGLNATLGADADYNRVLATSLNDQSLVRSVLSDEGEAQLKKRKFAEKDDCASCPIFHTPFEIDEEVTELPCGHIFSPEGIEKWLKEEKAECPVCRFKLTSREITREQLGIEQWAEDRTELSASRATLASNLRRLTFPTISQHPFGPASHRIANVIHEDDDRNDILRAISMMFEDPSVINNTMNNHTRNGYSNRINNALYVNDNDDQPSYASLITNRFQFVPSNSTTMTFPMHSDNNATSYENSHSLSTELGVYHQQEEHHETSSQENQRIPDNRMR